jgi:hypothetical protein
MVDVAHGADIDVGLGALELLLRHQLGPFPGLTVIRRSFS